MPNDQSLILIVDDEASIRRALLRLLRSAGLAGIAYGSAQEFAQALPLVRCRCIVLDVHMPGTNGIDLLQWLAQDWPCLPVIVVTGQHSAETETLVRSRRPLAYLQKPLDAEQLLGAILTTAP